MSYKIAIASSSGESVDQHFGQAVNFLVYKITENGAEFIEDRDTPLGTDMDEQLILRTELLSDCKAIFVLKIGMRSSRYLDEHKIHSFEVDYPINVILNKLVKQLREGRVKII